MKKAVTIEFDGDYDLKQIMEQLPDVYSKQLMQNIFAKGAAPFVRALRGQVKGSLKDAFGLVRGKSKENPTIWAGLVFKRGKSWTWQRTYWQAYGTLENRDESHHFSHPRRTGIYIKKRNLKHVSTKKPRNMWHGGIKPNRALQGTWGGYASKVEEIIQMDAAAVTIKFLNKYAAK